ncbi:Flp1 family type IVb pilin [Bdellovibrio sp. SKB1291214]|uniref:Flp1 family type IVb pilin n=1 Tax=Bdellovibrio sp. SKB1291214 TaxID=1732569 RepID=UPI000B51AF92|nr:Flp1 family type IVb pilin [Bdellovibrio sp. SKB1291214]UYL10440.1 Flp1 family type IVb pilin [Bdellovibrio sp. SKB1291214]
MKKFKNFSKKFLKNERGQGATEYILLLVVVVGLVMIFKDKIQTTVKDKISSLSSDITGVTSQ